MLAARRPRRARRGGIRRGPDDRRRPRRASALFRLFRFPRGPALHRKGAACGPRCARRHADRRGQVDVLSGSGHRAAGPRARDFPARVAYGRSGAGFNRRWRARGVSQFHLVARPTAHRDEARRRGHVQDHVRGARAFVRPGVSRVRRTGAGAPDRGGRGALRLPMGAGFPPVVSRNPRFHRIARPASARGGPDGHGHRARARRYRQPARAARPRRNRHRVRPPQSEIRRRTPRAEDEAPPHRRVRRLP